MENTTYKGENHDFLKILGENIKHIKNIKNTEAPESQTWDLSVLI